MKTSVKYLKIHMRHGEGRKEGEGEGVQQPVMK